MKLWDPYYHESTIAKSSYDMASGKENPQDRYIKCIGAIIPSAPYFFITSNLAITLSSIFSITALFVVGATVAVVSSKNVFWGALRMSMAGGAAAAVTFTIGNLIGASIIN